MSEAYRSSTLESFQTQDASFPLYECIGVVSLFIFGLLLLVIIYLGQPLNELSELAIRLGIGASVAGIGVTVLALVPLKIGRLLHTFTALTLFMSSLLFIPESFINPLGLPENELGENEETWELPIDIEAVSRTTRLTTSK